MCDHLTAVGRVATSLLLVPLKLPAMLILCQGRDFDDLMILILKIMKILVTIMTAMMMILI